MKDYKQICVILSVVVVLLLLLCVGGGVFGFVNWNRQRRLAADEQMRAAMEAQRQQEEAARQAEAERKEREARAEQEKRDREARVALEKKWQEEKARKEAEEKKLSENEARKAEASARRQAEEEAREQAEEEARRRMTELRTRRKPETPPPAESFSALKVMRVLRVGETLEDALHLVGLKNGDENDRAGCELTNANCVVVWHLADGVLTRSTTAYKRSLKGMKKTPVYELSDVGADRTSWKVYQIGTRAYWQHARIPIVSKLFAHGESQANLNTLVFGQDAEVEKLYAQWACPVYRVSWTIQGIGDCVCFTRGPLSFQVIHSWLNQASVEQDDEIEKLQRQIADDKENLAQMNRDRTRLLVYEKQIMDVKRDPKREQGGSSSVSYELESDMELVKLCEKYNLVEKACFTRNSYGRPRLNIRVLTWDFYPGRFDKQMEYLSRELKNKIAEKEARLKTMEKKLRRAKSKLDVDYSSLAFSVQLVDDCADCELDKPRILNGVE